MTLRKLDTLNINEIKETWQGKVIALTPAMHDNHWIAAVAVANEPGYSPLPMNWCNIEQGSTAYNDMADHLDQLNKENFGLDFKAAARVIASSMRAGKVG